MRKKKQMLNADLPITKRGEGPNPIDEHVGRRLRTLRNLRDISQDVLAIALGITFQQLQKYERGTNRISASKLYQFSKLLDVNPNYFFNGFGEMSDNSDLLDDLSTSLVAAFNKIEDERLKKSVISFLEANADAVH